MNYQVLVFLDEARDKSYYHAYFVSDDATLGNITCIELPPYQDINKVQACYWDPENLTWVFDTEKYAEILAQLAAEQEAAELAAAEQAATPTNAELMEATMDIAQALSDLEEAVVEIASMVAVEEGGEA